MLTLHLENAHMLFLFLSPTFISPVFLSAIFRVKYSFHLLYLIWIIEIYSLTKPPNERCQISLPWSVSFPLVPFRYLSNVFWIDEHFQVMTILSLNYLFWKNLPLIVARYYFHFALLPLFLFRLHIPGGPKNWNSRFCRTLL